MATNAQAQNRCVLGQWPSLSSFIIGLNLVKPESLCRICFELDLGFGFVDCEIRVLFALGL